MDMVCCPAALKGSVEAPPSKSASHRAVICAALARGETLLENIGIIVWIVARIGFGYEMRR